MRPLLVATKVFLQGVRVLGKVTENAGDEPAGDHQRADAEAAEQVRAGQEIAAREAEGGSAPPMASAQTALAVCGGSPVPANRVGGRAARPARW